MYEAKLAAGLVSFKNFNEKEETTIILSLTMLKLNPLKAYLLVPLLSILTLFALPIRMYWSDELKAWYLYDQVLRIEEADHLLVRGKDGNIEIVEVTDATEQVK